MPSQSETFTYTGELFRPTATQPIDKVLQVIGTRGGNPITFTADSDYVFTKNVPDGIQWVQGVPARTPDIGTSYTITYELGNPNPNLAFKPGDLIKSEDAVNNFSMLFNKLILVPIDTDTGPLVAASGYTLTNLQKSAIITVAVGNEPVEFQAIVDLFLTDDGEPVLDGADQVWGRVDVATGTTITVNFYKGPHNTPTSVSLTNSGVSMIIPVTTNFHKLPKDFLRTEFINSFESGFAEQTELNQLFRDTGLTKGASAILPTILNHTHTGSSWDDQVNHADLISGGVITHADIDLWLPTSNEKDALSGTNGTPSSGNLYVTDSDPRNSDDRFPLSHASTHESSGSDPIIASGITGVLADPQNIDIADNGGANIYTFPKIQFDNTGNVSFTVTSGSGKATITADASSGLAPGLHAATHEISGSDMILLQNISGSLPTTSLSGTVPISAGGTGSITASGAINALLPSPQTSGYFLTTNGTNTSWGPIAGSTAAVVDNILYCYTPDELTINVNWDSLAIEGVVATVGSFSRSASASRWLSNGSLTGLAPNTFYYLWAGCSDTGVNVTFYVMNDSNRSALNGYTSLPNNWTHWRRIGALKSGTLADTVVMYTQCGNIVLFDDPHSFLIFTINNISTGWQFPATNVSGFVSPTSRIGIFNIETWGNQDPSIVRFRPSGRTDITWGPFYGTPGSYVYQQVFQSVNESREIEVTCQSATTNVSVYAGGFVDTL